MQFVFMEAGKRPETTTIAYERPQSYSKTSAIANSAGEYENNKTGARLSSGEVTSQSRN